MKKTVRADKGWLESFPEDDKGQPFEVDDDFFRDLCFEEVELLCDSIGLSDFNKFIIILHCKGFRDKEIAERLQKYLPELCNATNISVANIKERRHYIIKKIKEKHGDSVGLITLLRETGK